MAQDPYYDYLLQHNSLVATDKRIEKELENTQKEMANPNLTADQKDDLTQRAQQLQGDWQQVKLETKGLEQGNSQYEQQRSGNSPSTQQTQPDNAQAKDRFSDIGNKTLGAVAALGVATATMAATPLPEKQYDQPTLSAPDHSKEFKDNLKDLADAFKEDNDKRNESKEKGEQAQLVNQAYTNTPNDIIKDEKKEADKSMGSVPQSPYHYNEPKVSYQSIDSQDDKSQAFKQKESLDSLLNAHQTNYNDACLNEAKGDGAVAREMANEKMLQTLDKQSGYERDLSQLDDSQKTHALQNQLKTQYGKEGEETFSKLQEAEQKQQQEKQQEQQNQQQLSR